MGRGQSPEPNETEFDRQGALTKAAPRPEKVVLGALVVEQVRKTKRPHRLISDRGLERLLHDLRAVETLPVFEVERAAHLHASFGRRMAPTAKQIEYFQLLADGLSLHEIAEKKGCSVAAVRTIIDRCIWNLGVTRGRGQGPAEAMAMLVAAGIVRGRPLPAFPKSKRGKGLRDAQGKFRKGGSNPMRPLSNQPTDRELSVISLIAEGASNERIAQMLGITEETVKSHVQRALRLTRARNRAHLVALAIRNEWV